MKEKKKSKTLVCNLFGGPGTGKSSSMANIFAELKWAGVNCEMAPEFAKEKVWEGSTQILSNQIYVFGKQLHAIHRVLDKVEVIITDSPLLLSLIYGSNECEEFKALVSKVYSRQRNLNIFLTRKKKYNPSGRLQSEKEAKKIDQSLLNLLEKNKIPYYVHDTGKESCEKIAKQIIEIIGKDKQLYK
jgi:hypothetical protein